MRPGLLILLLLTLISPASAHTLSTPRVLQVRVVSSRIEVGVALAVHSGPEARRLHEQFDADHSGDISPEEKETLAAWLDDQAKNQLHIELDGLPLAPQVGSRQVMMEARVEDGDAIRMRSVAAVALTLRPGRHLLVLQDAPENPRAIMPLRLDLWPGADLVDQRNTGDSSALSPGADQRRWSGGFFGQGGRVEIELLVPDRP